MCEMCEREEELAVHTSQYHHTEETYSITQQFTLLSITTQRKRTAPHSIPQHHTASHSITPPPILPHLSSDVVGYFRVDESCLSGGREGRVVRLR